jgi:hypothetical protein
MPPDPPNIGIWRTVTNVSAPHDGAVSLRAAVGALLAATTQQGSGLEDLRVVYPQGYLPMPEHPGEPTEGAPLELALRVNMIPPPGPVFRPSPRFVWEVYKDVLDFHRIMPIGQPGEDTSAYAGQFAAAQARFGDGQVTLSDLDYYPVDLLPADLSRDVWTPVALNAERLTALAAQLPEHTSDWLSHFNLLDELGDDLVESVTLETATVSVLRDWLMPEVFSWPWWDIDGDVLSDGADPAVGSLPAYVTTVAAARKLVIRLGPAELPDVRSHIVFRAAPGAATQAPATALDALVTLSGVGVAATPTFTLAPDTQSLRERVTEMPAEATPEGGYLRFHVPITFDVSPALAAAQQRLAVAQAARVVAEAQASATVTVTARDHRGPKVVEVPFQVRAADHNPELATALAAAQHTEQALGDKVTFLDQLGGLAALPGPYALAIGCTVVPRCPQRRAPTTWSGKATAERRTA